LNSARPRSAALAVFLALVAAPGAVSDSAFTPSGERKSTASLNVSANARIVGALAIQKVQDLEFGDVRVPEGAGSVTVRPGADVTAERTSAGGVVLAGTSFSAARFSISRSGADLSRVEVTLPSRAILSRVGGGEIVTVEDFVSTVVPGCAQVSCPASVVVGATVRVPASPVAGRYVGTFTVTVNAF
jgi:spore coat protein U-like protein